MFRLLFVLSVFLISACSNQLTSIEQSGAARGDSPAVTTLYDYTLYDPAGKPKSITQFLQEAETADVIMVGEWHAHPGVHLFQARLMSALAAAERPLSLSMEHFTRADQQELNRYLAGEIGESSLLKNTKAWDNYKSDYRPLVEIARRHQLPVVAANAPRDIVKCVGKQGPDFLQSLPQATRQLAAASVDISASPYREKFLGNMKGMQLSEARIAKMFGAQMTWDATMAESIAQHLASNPKRKVLHVAGKFHIEGGLGTGAELLKLRPQTKIMYISPVESEQVGKVTGVTSSVFRVCHLCG